MFDWNAYAIVGMQGTGVPEGATVNFDVLGMATVRVGFALEGQGQYTLAAQLVADYFGLAYEMVRVVPLDTRSAPPSFGPGGSRLGVAITGAVLGACDRVRAKMARVTSILMQTDAENIELMDGKFRWKGVEGAEMTVAEVAGTMLARSDLLPPDIDPRPEATHVWTASGRTPADEEGRAKSYLTAANACHVVMLEIDPETGHGRDPALLPGGRLRDASEPGDGGGADPGQRRPGRRRRAARGVRLRRRRAAAHLDLHGLPAADHPRGARCSRRTRS